jgi:hypothetical protein
MALTMAQIDLYLCKEEKLRLARTVFDMGLRMIPDLSYNAEEAIFITTLSEYEQYAYKSILMFIVDSTVSERSVVFGSFDKDGKTSFFLRQRYGFASIDFYSPGEIEMTEHRIGPGFLGNYPFYYDRESVKLYPSEKDKTVFKELRSFIKGQSTPAKLTNRTFWVGKQSIVLCRENGYQLVNIGDKNLLEVLQA